jgi:phage tail-like protein
MALMANVLNYVTPNRFYVELGGSIMACFSECSGLGAKIGHKPYMEGGVNNEQRILLEQTKFDPVTLKRGLTENTFFWRWTCQVMTEEPIRRNVNILTFNQAGETMQCWTLIGAVPVAWKAPALKATDATTVALETLTLAYEGLKVQSSILLQTLGRLSLSSAGFATVVERDSSGSFPSS